MALAQDALGERDGLGRGGDGGLGLPAADERGGEVELVRGRPGGRGVGRGRGQVERLARGASLAGRLARRTASGGKTVGGSGIAGRNRPPATLAAASRTCARDIIAVMLSLNPA